jgi:hypothetical protein
MSNIFILSYSELVFPTLCTDKEFKSFIANMLTKNQINRLYKLSQIKQNNWFKDFNWVKNLFNIIGKLNIFECKTSIHTLCP